MRQINDSTKKVRNIRRLYPEKSDQDALQQEIADTVRPKVTYLDVGLNLTILSESTSLYINKIQGFSEDSVQKVKFLLDAEIEKELISKTFEIPKSMSDGNLELLVNSIKKYRLRVNDKILAGNSIKVTGIPSVLSKFDVWFKNI